MQAGGYAVRVFEMGTGPRSFVLVHGIGVSHRSFVPLMRELATRYRVVAFDLPGHGGSPHADHALDVAELARVVAGVVDRLELRDPVLVGHSLGAQIVSDLVRQRPALATRIILAAPTVDPRRRGMINHFGRLVLDQMREPPQVNWNAFRDFLRCGLRNYLGTLRGMFADRIEDRLPDCPARVLVVRGARDPIAGHDWVRRAAALCAGTVAEIPGAAHAAQYTHARESAALYAEFAES